MSTFEIFDVASGQKGPFAALIVESSQNFFKRISWNQCDVIYVLPKIVQRAKFEAEIFSDVKRLGPLLQRSPLTYCYGVNGVRIHRCFDFVSPSLRLMVRA